MANPSDMSLQEMLRAKAEASVTLGLARKVRVYRVHQDDESVKCKCGFDVDCSLCYSTGLIQPYRVVEEVIVEKPHHSHYAFEPEHEVFMFSHVEELMQGDVFYWRQLGVHYADLEAYHIIGFRARMRELGVSEVLCRRVPSWSPLVKFPLEEDRS